MIDNDFNDKILDILFKQIDEWNGIKLSKSKKKYIRFYEYFTQSRNWWDNVKKFVYSSEYYLIIFYSINNHINNCSNKHYQNKVIFNESNKIYYKCLLIKVCKNYICIYSSKGTDSVYNV